MTAKQIRRLTGYPVFYIGASMFVYFLVTAGIYPYLDGGADQFALGGLLSGVYLKVLYAILCLLISAVAQFILIGGTHGNELRLSSIFSLVYFGVLGASMVALMIYAGVHSAPIIILTAVTPLALCVGEAALYLIRLLRANRETKEEDKASKASSLKQ